MFDLKNLPIEWGAEIDLRYHNDDLILAHDPFGHQGQTSLLTLKEFLNYFCANGPLILNIKTEGIEKDCIDLMRKSQVRDWFFLDLSMPYLVKYALEARDLKIDGFSKENLAVRFSEYENIEYAIGFKGMAQWVWVDCFTKMPLDIYHYSRLKDAGFNICLVSPELQGHSTDRISEFRLQLKGMPIEAVCTKRPDLWT